MTAIVIFDFDGTLYQTHLSCLPALREVCGRFGISLSSEDERYLLYTTTDSLLGRVAPELTPERRSQFKQEFYELEQEAVAKYGCLFDGVTELLCSLREAGVPIAICGMGQEGYIRAALVKCGISHFFSHVWARVEGLSKTEVLAIKLSEQGVVPADCVLVGDSITDLRAARDNRIPFIGVTYGYGAAEIANASTLVDNVAALKGEIFRHLLYQKIAARVCSLRQPAVVGINGVDCSGKTSFAQNLAEFLRSRGQKTELVHLDDFHKPRAVRAADPSPQGYLDNAFDLERLRAVVTQLKTGNPAEPELLELDSDRYRPRRFNSDSDTLIIVEGVMLFRPPLSELLDFKIFLDISFDEVLRRARQRDVPKYGEAFLQRYIDRYIPAQELYIGRYGPRGLSDLLIDNSDFNRPQTLN